MHCTIVFMHFPIFNSCGYYGNGIAYNLYIDCIHLCVAAELNGHILE